LRSISPASNSSPTAIVSFKDVRTCFGSETVLDGITFSVDEGEFVCVLGPSGCGKCTALRILGHLLTDYTGEVRLRGEPPARAWQHLGYVFQPWKSCSEHRRDCPSVRADARLSAGDRRHSHPVDRRLVRRVVPDTGVHPAQSHQRAWT